MSLYRTYRPQAFEEVVGQEHVVTTLRRSVDQGRLAHAYLFYGSHGTGKTSVARILAKHILISSIEDETQKKQILKGVEEGSLVDLIELDAASHTKVEEMRELIEKVQFAPVVAKKKVYIIDEVHMLSRSSFNALLKTLEEPPEYATFILATTEIHKIPETIQSRCQRFSFRHLQEDEIKNHLQDIAKKEKISIEEDALTAIARHVRGGMRDAIALLDQLRSLKNISLDDVRQRLGASGEEYVEPLLSALEQGNVQEILSILQTIEKHAVSSEEVLRSLLRSTRERLHKDVEERRAPQNTLALLETLLEAIRDIRSAPVPHLVLEGILVRLCSQKEKGRPEESIPIVEPEPQSRRQDDTRGVTDLSLQTFQKEWSKIIECAEIPPSARMSLKDGTIHSFSKDTVHMHFSSTFHRDKIAKADVTLAIEHAMEQVLRKNLRLHCDVQKNNDIVDVVENAEAIFQ